MFFGLKCFFWQTSLPFREASSKTANTFWLVNGLSHPRHLFGHPVGFTLRDIPWLPDLQLCLYDPGFEKTSNGSIANASLKRQYLMKRRTYVLGGEFPWFAMKMVLFS
jgi:hypothetical protein